MTESLTSPALGLFVLLASIAVARVVHWVTRKFFPVQTTPPTTTTTTSADQPSTVTTTQHLLEYVDYTSETSLTSLATRLSELFLIVLYTWLCENAPPFPHAPKIHDVDFFHFIMLAMILASLYTIRKSKHDEGILNRDQSEEWRGVMQIVFLLYHVFKLEEVYNVIRLFISCYVFLTGFGNTSFFYLKKDYSLTRVVQMLWRLTFTCVLLSLAHSNTIMLYYIIPLHTFYFFLTYATMAIFQSYNYTKYGLKLKCLVVFGIIWIVWEFPVMFDACFFFMSERPHPNAPVAAYGNKYEWAFRSGLDHWSAAFGIVFAVVFPQVKARFEFVEKSSAFIGINAATLAVLGGMAGMWYVFVFQKPKLEYNAVHPYFFCFPMLAYLFARNCGVTMRTHHLGLFAELGKITLETYLLQHHIWLTSNAKTVLVWIPDSPKLNFCLTTAVYFYISKRLYKLTLDLRALLIPNDSHDNVKVLQAVTNFCGVLGFFVFEAFLLFDVLGVNWALGASMAVMIHAGVWLTMTATWIKPSSPNSDSTTTTSNTNPQNRKLRIAVGLLCTLLGVSAWATRADRIYVAPPGTNGVGASNPSVRSCPDVTTNINDGAWVSNLGDCSSSSNGFAVCRPRAWAWAAPNACGFTRRTTIGGNGEGNIVFVGSTPMVKNVFAGMVRAVGESISLASPAREKSKSGKIWWIKSPDVLEDFVPQRNDIVVIDDMLPQATSSVPGWDNGVRRIIKLLTGKGVPGKKRDGVTTTSSPEVVIRVDAIVAGANEEDVFKDGSVRDVVYDVLAQLTLNVVAVTPSGSSSSSSSESGKKESGKGSGGSGSGLARNPVLGLCVWALLMFCLWVMDSFLTIHALWYRVARMIDARRYGLDEITWEGSVRKLHISIGDVFVPGGGAVAEPGGAEEERIGLVVPTTSSVPGPASSNSGGLDNKV